MQTLSDLHSSEEDGEGNGGSVDQNEREVPNEESNPLKSRLRRESCYLTGSDNDPAHLCFQDGAWVSSLAVHAATRTAAHVSWPGSKTSYERVELPALTLSGVHGQACLIQGKAHAIHDRQDRISPKWELSSFTIVWPGAGEARSETRRARGDVPQTGRVS